MGNLFHQISYLQANTIASHKLIFSRAIIYILSLFFIIYGDLWVGPHLSVTLNKAVTKFLSIFHKKRWDKGICLEVCTVQCIWQWWEKMLEMLGKGSAVVWMLGSLCAAEQHSYIKNLKCNPISGDCNWIKVWIHSFSDTLWEKLWGYLVFLSLVLKLCCSLVDNEAAKNLWLNACTDNTTICQKF